MAYQKLIIKQNDGKEVYGYCWKSESPSKGNVVIAHGMCEYSLRYEDFAEFLCSNGYNVYSLDHLGHGINASNGLGVWDKNGFDQCVDNIHELIKSIQESNAPIYLLGHSMGSYMSQYYIEKYGKEPIISKMILIGTSGPRGAFKLGKFIAKFTSIFKKLSAPAPFLKKMSFSGFNKKIKKAERYGKNDWISSNLEIRKKYGKDPFCTFVPSVGFYYSFFSSLVKLHSKKYRALSSKDVDIFIIGGKEDPVTMYGKGMRELSAIYSKMGIKT